MTTGMTGVMRHGVQLLKTYEKDGKKYYLLKPEGVSQRVLAEEEDIRILFSFPLSDVVSFGRMPKWVRRKYKDVFQTIDDFVQHGFMQYMIDAMHGIAYTLKITMGCNFACRYCLPGNTRILMADGTWKPIKDIKEGEYVIGWIKQNTYTPVKVLRTFQREDTVYRVITEHGEIHVTDNHPVMGHTRWLAIEPSKVTEVQSVGRLRINSRLRYIGMTENYTETKDYMLGYLAGVFYGDGTYIDQIAKGTGRSRYLRLVVKDREIIDRVKRYMNVLGIYYTEGVFRATSEKSYKKGEYPRIYVTRKRDIARIREIRSDNKEWLRGFAAGFFDAEGSAQANGGIRWNNKNKDLLKIVQRGLKEFGFEAYIREDKKRKTYVLYLRVTHSHVRLRFFTTFRPAVKRKNRGILHLKARLTRVKGIVEVGTQKVYNLQTESGTYIAEGFIVHNCYEAQRMGDNVIKMPKKIIREAIRKTAQFGGGSIAIHGGEPGLYPEGIEYAAKMVQKYKKLYKPAYLSLHLQTNGLAAYTALDIIKEYKIAVGISYDGRYQDKYRVFKDGSSTKDFVLKAIKIFKENNVPVMGISVVDKEMDPAKVYEDNVKAGLTRFRLNPMYPVGHPILKDKMMPPERYVEMLNTAVDKMLANKEVHERRIEEYVGPMWGIKPVVCINIPCHAGLNFFDIDVEGNVAVCDAIPQLKIGNIMKDDWWDFMFHPKSIDFRFRHSELGKPCMTCPFKYHCDGGGCEGFLEQMGWPADKQGPFCPKSVFAKIYGLSYEDQLRLAPKSARKTFGPIILG